MRTRFLNIDYFSSAPTQFFQTLAFLHLPVHHLPNPHLSTIEDLIRFDSVPNVSLQIDRLPIDAALSKFFSGVLPQKIHVRIEDFNATVPSRNQKGESGFGVGTAENQISEGRVDEENGEECRSTLGPENLDSKFPRKNEWNAIGYKDTRVYKVIQFETPELDVFLENDVFSEEEKMEMLSEVPTDENNLGMLDPELSMHHPYEVLESIYSVEGVTSEYALKQTTYSFEDNCSLQDLLHFHQSTFPLLEEDEGSLRSFPCLCKEEEVGSFLENIEQQDLDEKYNSLILDKEGLGFVENNVLELLSDLCLSKLCLEPEPASPKKLLGMEFMITLETSQVHQKSTLHGTSHVDCDFSMEPVVLQEFQFLDKDSSQNFESFFNRQTTCDPESIEWIFKKDLNFKNFDELVTSNELALIDDSFKSLPLPVISDYGKMICLYVIVEEILASLKPQPLSASDGIYLNWDLLEGDERNGRINFLYQNILAKIDSNSIDFDQELLDNGKLVLDLILSDDTLNGSYMEEYMELQKLLSDGNVLLDNHPVGVASSELLDDGYFKQETGEQIADRNAERASLLFKSMSEVSHLDYFLNPQKATSEEHTNPAAKSTDTSAKVLKVPHTDLISSCTSTGVQPQQWHIVLYQVKLSDNIAALIESFEKSYLAILQTDTELKRTSHSFSDVESFKLPSLQKQELVEFHGNENSVTFVALGAIKQAAWYMCYYGLHPACLYVNKLCESSERLKSRLNILQSLINDGYRMVDSEITMSHPSLTVIKEILQSNIKRSSLKALIVAEKFFWWSLKSLLLSLGLSFNEIKNFHANQPDLCNNTVEFRNAEMKDLLASDCLLVSPEHVSAIFPFNKFSIILEYGGSYRSSRISYLSPSLVGLPHIHFLKVDLGGSFKLCEGVEMPQDIEMLTEEESDCGRNNKKLKKQLNFCPQEDKYERRSSKAAGEVEDCSMVLPISPGMGSGQSHQNMESSHGAVIIVNTQNTDKEMIVSRRSTYQVILALEREGVQVVERDAVWPVDIIISSSICLVWYASGNIGKKATPINEACSCLPLCIDNIATNVLTMLSFTFSGCFLVFEGQTDFVLTVMESSDGLYAAAASLGIDLQLFFSYSSEMTNEIIVNCIKYATKLTRGLYPKMPESVTLAESFLTEFPSINTLMAHAILSYGDTLRGFIQCSHERRIFVLQKYNVPDESVALFSAFCRYGEREDSKSIMTDCSSSVSSGPDSDRNQICKVDSGRKRQKCIGGPQEVEICLDDWLQFVPLEGILDSSTISKSCNLRVSKDPGTSDDLGKASFSMNDLFGQRQGQDVAMMRSASRPTRTSYDSRSFNSSQITNDEMNKPCLSLNDKLLAQNRILETAIMDKQLERNCVPKSQNLHEDISGEVIDLTDSPVLDKNFSFIEDSMNFSSLAADMENDHKRKTRIARRLSFDNSRYPTFPVAADINPTSNIWSSSNNKKGNFQGGLDKYPETVFEMETFPGKLSNDGLTHRFTGHSQGLPFQEEIAHFNGTPLKCALRSANPLQSSPWTVEFLNRIKEKSRIRQQVSCDTSAASFGYSGNISKMTKRRSPPIIELFKYQGGRTPGKIPEKKRQQQPINSSNSTKKGKCSASLLPSCTPNDKKARKTLTFAMNESGTQTKLVWSDRTHMTKKFQNQP